MIVMIEEIPGAKDLYLALPNEHLIVRRAWVQHHHELITLALRDPSGQDPDSVPMPPTFMGLPLRLADEKKWNELLLLEGSKRVTALDWPTPLQTGYSRTVDGDHIVLANLPEPTINRGFIKYVA